jgi:hypothetical protein
MWVAAGLLTLAATIATGALLKSSVETPVRYRVGLRASMLGTQRKVQSALACCKIR